MVERPTVVKIGHLDYAVKWMNSDWALKTERNGEISYIEEEIRILDGMSPQSTACTFLHEIIHGLTSHYDRTGTEPIERETVSEWIGAGLVMFWRDNPDAFAWWSSLLTEVDR